MADNKKERRGLGRGLSALISNSISNNVTSVDENNVALNVDEIFAKNFEKEKAKELQEKNKSEKNKKYENESVSLIDRKLSLVDDKNVSMLSIDNIITNIEQPREDFSEKSLKELAVSIEKHGVLQPILVRKKSDKFEIVAGERRFRAAKLAGLKEVPVIFKKLEDDDAYEIAVIENIQRENLNPIEEAKAYKKLMQKGKMNQNELGEKIGKDRSTISNLLRILELPTDVQDLIKNKELTLGHAKVLLSLKKVEAQKSFAKRVCQEGLSVRELEKLVSDVWVLDAGRAHKDLTSLDKKMLDSSKDSRFSDIIEILRQKLGTRVNIKHQKNGKGKIEVEYYSEDELERVFQIITKDIEVLA